MGLLPIPYILKHNLKQWFTNSAALSVFIPYKALITWTSYFLKTFKVECVGKWQLKAIQDFHKRVMHLYYSVSIYFFIFSSTASPYDGKITAQSIFKCPLLLTVLRGFQLFVIKAGYIQSNFFINPNNFLSI